MPQPSSSARTDLRVHWLGGGLFLGMVLLFAAVLLFELAIGHGLLGPNSSEIAAIHENQQSKEAAQVAERSVQQLVRAKDERIRNLENDLENARRMSSRDNKKLESPAGDFWQTLQRMANGIEMRQAKESKAVLDATKKENEELKKKNKGLEAKLALITKSKPLDADARESAPNDATPSSLEEENAKQQFEKALDFAPRDKSMAIKLLKKLIDEHPKTKAAKEAKSLLAELVR